MEDSLGLKICPECGADLFSDTPAVPETPAASPAKSETTQTVSERPSPSPSVPNPQKAAPVQPAYVPQQPGQSLIINGKDYTPISMWGYFGYELLFSIPLIGFIILLVFAFGGTNRVNLKNFARSYFCLTIIVAILVTLIVLMIVGGGFMLGF